MRKSFEFESIDYNEIYTLVLDASRKTFQGVLDAHPDETFYMFGFHEDYPTALSCFMLPICHSEEAHMRLRNLTDLERERQTLEWFYKRWEPAEWEYYRSGEKHFNAAWKWVHDNLRKDTHPPEEDHLVRANIANKMSAMYLKVLKTLDEEKLFGQGAAREGVVLNVVAYDQSYFNKYDSVRLLNSDSTYKRWCIEMELSRHAREVFDPRPRSRFDRKPN